MGFVMTAPTRPVGQLIREWRQRRRLSQLDLADEADISTRHLSFLETGRASPSREMVSRLAERLAIPLRERNVLLSAAGFAPTYHERSLDDPDFRLARRSIDLLLSMQELNPAFAVDRHWTMMAANKAIQQLTVGVDPMLLKEPVNAIRLYLHPVGLAPRIMNLTDWRHHVLERLRQQVDVSGDQILTNLLEEVHGYPIPDRSPKPPRAADHELVAVPFRLATVHGPLSFFNTTTVFGRPVDITLSELAVESFFPADQVTVAIMRRLAVQTPEQLPRPAPRAVAG
jgi:transcriptional regulator with XRE-family HTH domain